MQINYSEKKQGVVTLKYLYRKVFLEAQINSKVCPFEGNTP